MNYGNADLNKIVGWDVGQVAAVYAARRSGIYKFKTGAALVKDNKVVEIGWSHVGEIAWSKTPWSTHAEVHAIRRAGPLAAGCDLYIATISRKGNITMAYPCNSCEDYLRNTEIKTVRFSIKHDQWGTALIS